MPTFMKYLGEVWRCANLYRAEHFEELEIGSYQDSYILEICKQPGIAQEKLAGLIYVHKSNVARQLNSLEEKGFVTRIPDKSDKRNLLVYPTEKALAALPAIRLVQEQWNRLVLEGLSATEQGAVAEYLRILAENAKRVADRRGEEKN